MMVVPARHLASTAYRSPVLGRRRRATAARHYWAMCVSGNPGPTLLYDVAPPFEIDIEPVDAVTVTTVMDNVSDIFMPDQGLAKRFGPGVLGEHLRPAVTMQAGDVFEVPLAEHGFSALVEITKGGCRHRVLFDAGTSPDGVVDNMRLLGIDPSTLEAIVCSHGHFDHTTGIDGLIRTLGRANLPVLIHPHFWWRRRVLLPGRVESHIRLPTLGPTYTTRRDIPYFGPRQGHAGAHQQLGSAGPRPRRPVAIRLRAPP